MMRANDQQLRIALAGNPNSGKTTLFNALTGGNQYVGNWPGVTVEKKEGYVKGKDHIIIQDLPGIYSLSPLYRRGNDLQKLSHRRSAGCNLEYSGWH